MSEVRAKGTDSSGTYITKCLRFRHRHALSSYTSSAVTAGLTSALLLGLCMPALALNDDAQSIKVGEADFTPTVRLDYVTDSNGALDSDNEKSVTGVVLSPQVELVADRRLLSLTLGYTGSYGVFSEDPLDYDDHALSAGLQAGISSRQRLLASLRFVKGHDRLDAASTFDQGGEQLEHLNTVLNARYIFGSAAARGNLVGGFVLSSKSYTNLADDVASRDSAVFAPFGRFSYRLSSDARAFVELRFREVDFDENIDDRTEVVSSVGIAFSETGKTGGEAKIGITSAQYDADSRDDTDLLSADISLYYEPSNISRFDIRFARQLNDVDTLNATQVTSDAIDDNLSLLWTYNWSGFVTTRASLGAEVRNRECPVQGSTVTFGGAEIGFKARRWLELGAGVQFDQRSGDNCVAVSNEVNSIDYERQRINVFARATL